MFSSDGNTASAEGRDVMANLARMHNRLLQNTVEMYTTPETYPVWKTKKPVVVIDDGKGGENALFDGSSGEQTGFTALGPLVHRYRYVAVTPGATIDWDLVTKRDHDDDGNSSAGRNTVSTTPPGSDDEREDDDDLHSTSPMETNEEEKVLHYDRAVGDDEEHVVQFPPVLYENPPSLLQDSGNAGVDSNQGGSDSVAEEEGKRDTPKRQHKRSHSLFDAQGNPIVLTTTGAASHDEPESPSAPASATSFSSFASEFRPTQVLTWDDVSALPYRTRTVSVEGRNNMQDVEIVDQWNESGDVSFQNYWESKRIEKLQKDNTLTDTTVTQKDDTTASLVNEDDDPMDAMEKEVHRESIFIVCYHLPVILTRDPDDSTWTACWSESLIAKSETHGVSSTRKTTWIGTVSNIPAQFLADENEREAIRVVLKDMDCIPIFFVEEGAESVSELHYLGFCKQVLWPSFHNVDLLDLATNGWGQRQRKTRLDPVQACALAAAEAKERKRSASVGGPSGPVEEAETANYEKLQSDWGELVCFASIVCVLTLSDIYRMILFSTSNPCVILQKDQSRLDRWWNAYQFVNRKFSKVVAELVEGGDIVWVHDYHLALMPRMLREARNETKVVSEGKRSHLPLASIEETGDSSNSVRPIQMVFFIHVPFPTSQVFRELEHGEALLEGMLHADVVGFHAFDHARHFLNAAKRILGLGYESLMGGLIGVRHRGTKVLVTVSNVSVETDIVDALMSFPSVQDDAEALRQKHEGRTIIAGIDVAQRLSGVSLKLLAFERLLTDYPVWQSKVVLLQRCLIPGNRRVDEADTLREVRFLVKKVSHLCSLISLLISLTNISYQFNVMIRLR